VFVVVCWKRILYSPFGKMIVWYFSSLIRYGANCGRFICSWIFFNFVKIITNIWKKYILSLNFIYFFF